MIWLVRHRSVEHLAHWIFEAWPWRYLSVGGSIGSSCAGAGLGVAAREKGFEEGVSVEKGVECELAFSFVAVAVVECAELQRALLRLLRRKDKEGRR